jgi:hypothetical protein
LENEETDLSSVFYEDKVKKKTSFDWLDYDFRAIQQKEKDQLNSFYDNIDVIFGKKQNKTEKNAFDKNLRTVIGQYIKKTYSCSS